LRLKDNVSIMIKNKILGGIYMHIRRATVQDMDGLMRLLRQVLMVHHKGRPDLFKPDAEKYTPEELTQILQDDTRPIFVGVDEEENVLVYAFCIFQQHINNNILTDIKTLYIDDLCVDEKVRGQHLGSTMFKYVKEFAKESGCYNLTLNVWALNESAMKFYQRMGMDVQKTYMENIL